MKSIHALILLLLLAARAGALSLDELAAQPALWPAEVKLTKAAKATQLRDGRPAGAMLIGAGKMLVVTGVSAAGVTGRFGTVTVLVPAESTDLMWRVGQASPEHASAEQREVQRSAKAVGDAIKSLAPAEEAAPAAPVRATTPPAGAAGFSRIQRQLSGRLVRLDGDALQPVDVAGLGGVKYYGLYFSASWCGPCRQFTPELVNAYRKLKQQHPEFEVVFVSADRSAGAMRDYMRDDRMPWLALKYDQREAVPEIMRYSGPGIPCLVLVDAQGRVLADSFEGDNYLGPNRVLDEATRLLARGG